MYQPIVKGERGAGGASQLALDQFTLQPALVKLGSSVLKTDIQTTEGPFMHLPEYRTNYPTTVKNALASLYAEYNLAFDPLIRANREWPSDYQYCMTGPAGTPTNYFVQIDMVGLPEDYLKAASQIDENQVREDLRGRIFEIENSLAMYQLLIRLFSNNGTASYFGNQFRETLDMVRQMHNKPIALLAVTDQKYQAMRASEFGKQDGEPLTDLEVMTLSGFDKFFGPDDFLDYVKQRGGSDYLLYVRSSDPLEKLKDPNATVEHPLLQDDDIRRLIKANAITINIDNPNWTIGDPRRINDTKEYLPTIGMGFPINSEADLFSDEFKTHLAGGKPFFTYSGGDHLSHEFSTFLLSQGVQPEDVVIGKIHLRAKPIKGTYGCYGHHSAELGNTKFRQDLRQNLRKRGSYVVQPEMRIPILVNEADGQEFMYIDRNFLGTDGTNYIFMGGFRSLMPIDSKEAGRGRNHGSKFTVWGEVC